MSRQMFVFISSSLHYFSNNKLLFFNLTNAYLAISPDGQWKKCVDVPLHWMWKAVWWCETSGYCPVGGIQISTTSCYSKPVVAVIFCFEGFQQLWIIMFTAVNIRLSSQWLQWLWLAELESECQTGLALGQLIHSVPDQKEKHCTQW